MRRLADFGRFSEPALLVLVSLLGGEKHGYAISADITALTGRSLGPGTLYGAISRLEEAGLVQSLPSEGRRRPYTLTARGLTVAGAEVERLTALAHEAGHRLRLRGAQA